MSESSTIQIGQREIQYALTEASGVKTVRLKLNPDLKLEISIPSGSSVDVSALLKRKRDWIERKYYVILHELAHLREFNHSRRFKYLLASVCPDFRDREMMLKRFITNEESMV